MSGKAVLKTAAYTKLHSVQMMLSTHDTCVA